MSAIGWLSASESWEGMFDKLTAAKKEPILLKTEASPRPLKHGQVCWQTSTGGCTQPRTCCP